MTGWKADKDYIDIWCILNSFPCSRVPPESWSTDFIQHVQTALERFLGSDSVTVKWLSQEKKNAPVVKVVKEQEKPGGSQVMVEVCSTGTEHPEAHCFSISGGTWCHSCMPKNWLSPSRHQFHLERGTTFVVLKAMAHVPIVTHCSFGKGDILTAGKSLTASCWALGCSQMPRQLYRLVFLAAPGMSGSFAGSLLVADAVRGCCQLPWAASFPQHMEIILAGDGGHPFLVLLAGRSLVLVHESYFRGGSKICTSSAEPLVNQPDTEGILFVEMPNHPFRRDTLLEQCECVLLCT